MIVAIIAFIAFAAAGLYLVAKRGPGPCALEFAIYNAIGEIGDGVDAIRIHQHVEALFGQQVSIGELYGAFGRMEEAGLIRSWQELYGLERDCGVKRCFALVEEGESKDAISSI